MEVALGHHCCVWALSSCGEWGLLSSCSMWTSPCSGFLLWSTGCQCEGFSRCSTRAQSLQHTGSVVASRGLQSIGSVVVAHGFSSSAAVGIFQDQRLNPCLLHWQADSYPLYHQGSPGLPPFMQSDYFEDLSLLWWY